MRLVFAFSGADREITGEDAQWLIAELLAANEQSSALGKRLQGAAATTEVIETSTEEKRRLLQVFERSTRPRSHELRALEIALHAEVFASSPHRRQAERGLAGPSQGSSAAPDRQR
jgi:hypothetical protein